MGCCLANNITDRFDVLYQEPDDQKQREDEMKSPARRLPKAVVSKVSPNAVPLKLDDISTTTTEKDRLGLRRDRREKRPSTKYKTYDKREPEMLNGKLVTTKTLTMDDRRIITKALKKVFIFSTLTEEDREMVVNSLKYYSLKPGEFVFRQGQAAQSLYILDKGSAEVLVEKDKSSPELRDRVNILRKGECFGERALLHDTPRSASIRTLEQCHLWSVDRETFRKVLEDINRSNYDENFKFLNDVPLISNLLNQEKQALASALVVHKYAPGETIVKEGDTGDIFFIVKEGIVSCQKQGEGEKRRLTKGDYFGEQALLYHCKRTLSVVAHEKSAKCVAIGKETLEKILGDQLEDVLFRNVQKLAFDRSHTLRKLLRDQVEKLIAVAEKKKFGKGEVVIPKDEPLTNCFLTVLRGSIMRADGKIVKHGESFGDKYLTATTESGVHTHEVKAREDDTEVGVYTKKVFEETLSGTYTEVVQRNRAHVALSKVNLLHNLSSKKIKKIAQALEICKFKDGDNIMEQGDRGDSFYIIVDGIVGVYRDGVQVRTMGIYDYFGERTLILEDEVRTATITAQGDATCWMLRKESFMAIMEETMKKYLIKRIALQDVTSTLSDFACCKRLGSGMFGNVYLVRPKDADGTKDTHDFALKCVPRWKIEQFQLEENLILERNILLRIDHPFIMKLVKTYKDDDRLYFLTEYIRGIELFDAIREIGLLNRYQAQFYTASMIMAMSYLHERNIVYRDLKPENIMVDEDGYIKVIDFGTAKIIEDRTYTIVGTPHYMAPEVVVGKGYGLMVDFWTIGICLYEFLFGKVPFGEEEEDPQLIYEEVLGGRLEFNSYCTDKQARMLIAQLLQRRPAMRMGGSTVEAIKKHKWFQEFDWDRLLSRALDPPLVPMVRQNHKERLTNLIQTIEKECDEGKEEYLKSKKRGEQHKAPKDWDQDF